MKYTFGSVEASQPGLSKTIRVPARSEDIMEENAELKRHIRYLQMCMGQLYEQMATMAAELEAREEADLEQANSYLK